MDTEKFQMMLEAVRNLTADVELDVQEPIVATSIPLLQRLDDERRASIASGERVAYLILHAYVPPPGRPKWAYCAGVDRAQALALLEAGARWVGPEDKRPR